MIPLDRLAPGSRPALCSFVLSLACLASPAFGSSDAGEPLTGFHREWVWSVFGGGVGFSGLEVVDVDRDGRLDVLASAVNYDSLWYVARHDGAALRQFWSALPVDEPLRAVQAVALAERTEILVVTETTASVYDGTTKSFLRDLPTGSLSIRAARVGNLDGGSGLELAFCDDDGLRVLDFATGTPLATQFGFDCFDLAIGEVDGDFASEIALSGNNFGGYVLDGLTLAVQWAELSGFGRRARFVDLDADGLDEIVCGRDGTGDLRAMEPTTGATLWYRADPSTAELGVLEPGDLDGAGSPEILLGDAWNGTVHVLDGATGGELWSIGEEFREIHGLAAGDVDADGTVELLWGGNSLERGSGLFAVNAVTHQFEAQSLELNGPFHGFAVEDVDADGRPEVVTAGRAPSASGDLATSLLEFDAATHELRYVGPTTSEDDSYPRGLAAVQLDGDAPLEVCVAIQPSNGLSRIRCEDGGSHEVQWQITFPSGVEVESLLAADVRGGVMPEILAGSDRGYVYAFHGATGWLAWRSPPLGDWASFSILRLGEVTGDAATEVVAVASDSYRPMAIVAAETGALVGGPFDAGIVASDLAQLDGAGALEIVAGTLWGEVGLLDPVSGQLSPPIAELGYPLAGLRVVDLTRDGSLDLIALIDSRLVVWGGAEQAVLWTSPHLGEYGGRYDTFWIGNFDTDFVPEIAVNTANGIALFEVPLATVFADGFESGDTSAWSVVQP